MTWMRCTCGLDLQLIKTGLITGEGTYEQTAAC